MGSIRLWQGEQLGFFRCSARRSRIDTSVPISLSLNAGTSGGGGGGGVPRRFSSTHLPRTGGDVRVPGGTFSARLRPDGTLVPRNAFIQPAQNRTDIRLQQKLPLSGRRSVDLIAEVFNAFNRTNYTIVTTESAANFNKPGSGQNRSAQIGFRLAF